MSTANGPALDIVFFDVDDTLYSTSAFSEAARRAAIAAMIDEGLDIDLEAGFAELMEVVSEFTSNYPQHFGRLLDRLGPGVIGGRNPAVIIAAGVVAYHRAKVGGLTVLGDVHALLERLRGADIRLGIISAGLPVKQAEKLIRLDVLRFFDPGAIFFSDQIGVNKPNPKIYLKACETLGVLPERAMYVGDKPDADITPARKIGMHTVHYTGALGRHRDGNAAPHHRLDDLRELANILRDEYGMPL